MSSGKIRCGWRWYKKDDQKSERICRGKVTSIRRGCHNLNKSWKEHAVAIAMLQTTCSNPSDIMGQNM